MSLAEANDRASCQRIAADSTRARFRAAPVAERDLNPRPPGTQLQFLLRELDRVGQRPGSVDVEAYAAAPVCRVRRRNKGDYWELPRPESLANGLRQRSLRSLNHSVVSKAK
jgi:hypothetical protein